MDSQPPLPPPFPIPDITGPTSWPRRAAKACASCRRDKVRCDGKRPCGCCIKKGFSPEQCTDGCEHCRRARVRCADGKPCARCREMRLACVDEPSTSTFRQDSSTRSHPRVPRPKSNDRAKLACQNCRRDNKKCGDTRPCQRCVTRGEECVHVGRGPKLVKLRCEACRKEHKKCEDVRPCKFCIEQGTACVSPNRRGRGHGTRVKAACTNCREVDISSCLFPALTSFYRRDKIKCDGIRPCSACARKGYDCVDRACGSCVRDGREAECTHCRPQEAGSDRDHDSGDNALASSSSTSQHLPTMPPYIPFSYNIPPYYVPSPQLMSGPGQPPLPMQLHPIYGSDNRPTYYPVIDPHIDDPPGPVISSERIGASLSSPGGPSG